ncbi:MAG TPA: ThuA domain-containing protein [Clostridia bacterium]|nr:ThuA domain-containing protein [Clostridia bacterium]
MHTTIPITLLALTLATTLLTAVPATAADAPPKKIQVLLVTGDDVDVHNWLEVSHAIRETLLAANKFDVRICEDAGILDSTSSLARYDLVFLHMFNAKTPTLSDAAKENLLNFVKNGKGFAVSHLSSASFKEWPEFQKLCGRYWVMGKSGHGPRSTFKVNIAKQAHPITAGLTGFEADDELYAKMQGTAPITALVEADSDWSNQTEPLAFILNYGKGRVFHEAFGHDGKAIRNPSVQKLIQRGCEWAATGKVE